MLEYILNINIPEIVIQTVGLLVMLYMCVLIILWFFVLLSSIYYTFIGKKDKDPMPTNLKKV